ANLKPFFPNKQENDRMEPLVIQPTPKTPDVHFDPINGTLDITGMSYPEHGHEFYKPVIDWIQEYGKNPREETIVNIQFKYFNTSSAKSILALLQKINEIRLAGNTVQINWHYELNDEQMIQDGENYSSLLNLPFNMVQIA